MKSKLQLFIIFMACVFTTQAKGDDQCIEAPHQFYAWRITPLLGERYRIPLDTTFLNYYNVNNMDAITLSNSYLGNLGSPSQSRIFFDREITPPFMFSQPFEYYYVTPGKAKFMNTKIPITQLSYNSGGSKTNGSDNLKAYFSGNVNRKLAFGGSIDYLYARGYYAGQGVKQFSWQLFGSYISDRYQLHTFTNSTNFTNQENGGIKDNNYILNPEEILNGRPIASDAIPVNLTKTWNRVRGGRLFATQHYNLGFEKERVDTITKKDTTEFIPVASIIHTINYTDNFHRFIENNVNNEFFKQNYLDTISSNDTTKYFSIKNTIGLSLREGFHKYAKFGITGFASFEHREYKLTQFLNEVRTNTQNQYLQYHPISLAPFVNMAMPYVYIENLLFVGGQISKTMGKTITYNAGGEFGLTGSALGEVRLKGELLTKIPLFKDSVMLRGYGSIYNTEPSFLLKHYISNHFVWDNNFGKERRVRFGGELRIPRTQTYLNIGVENLQNYVYFNNEALPTQESDIIQVLSASLSQNFKFGIWNLDNHATYQKTSNATVVPLPELSLYSNMYLNFKIARVLDVQFGVDCRYFTSYYSPAYQPATMSFVNQHKIKIGNYPLMNAYANMKLKKTKFFVMFYHVNQGMFGDNNYFSLPNYPIDPRVFRIGILIDFNN